MVEFVLNVAAIIPCRCFFKKKKFKNVLNDGNFSCTGLALIVVGSNVNEWLTDDGVQMTTLTCVFFCVNILASTQDIIIDGWSLTLLRR